MTDSEPAKSRGGSEPLIRRLGWQHTGFRADRRGAAIALAVILAIPATLDLIGGVRFGLTQAYGDLRIFFDAARNHAANPEAPLYENNRSYLYPPFFLTLIQPLAALPDEVGVPLFQLGKWVALYFTLLAAWRLCSPPGEDLPPLVALGSLLLSVRFILNDMGIGNINLLMTAAVVCSGYLLLKQRPVLAGGLIGVAACIKITPVLVAGWFVYRGWWRTLIGAVIAGVVCLLLWPAVFLGWDYNLAALAEWNEYILGGYLSRGVIPSWIENQSLAAVLNRLLGAYALDGDSPEHLPRVLPDGAINALRLALTGSIGLTLLWATWRRLKPTSQPLAFAAELGLVQVAMLVLSGISWKAHFVGLLLPYVVLAAFVCDARYPRRARRAAGVWLLLSFVACTLTGDIVTEIGVYYAELFGAMLWSAIFAGGGLIVVRRTLTTPDSIQTEVPCPSPIRAS